MTLLLISNTSMKNVISKIEINGKFSDSIIPYDISIFDIPGSMDENPIRKRERLKMLERARYAIYVINGSENWSTLNSPILKELKKRKVF